VATVVFFHAHPDDECMLTGGTMAKLAAAGHRVVLVTATRGEHGEVPDGVLAAGETLGQHRTREVQMAAGALGAARVAFLDYVDSGMMGTPENDAADCFWRADVEEAAERLAAVLNEERAGVLVVYDDNGSYGHPDHIQVHRVGVRGGRLAQTPVVYEAVIDRDRVAELVKLSQSEPGTDDLPDIDITSFGVPGDRVTTRVDVSGYTDAKRRALAFHASQIADTSWALDLTPERFARAFEQEQFIRQGVPAGTVESDLYLADGR
jgi:LmbE family N-acetylglucosaminyl deacetylase